MLGEAVTLLQPRNRNEIMYKSLSWFTHITKLFQAVSRHAVCPKIFHSM